MVMVRRAMPVVAAGSDDAAVDAAVDADVRRVNVLGATGSVGRAALDVMAADPRRYEVETLVANRNAGSLARYAKQLNAKSAVVADVEAYRDLKSHLAGSGIEVSAGLSGLRDAMTQPVDITVAAIVGAAGLEASLHALRYSKMLALANKECLVCAGRLFMDTAKRHNCQIIPIDSEHNALFQLLEGDQKKSVERMILTASGGPFRSWTREQMVQARPEQALRHPNWDMGAKISIDSASMMNKGLELIEAHHLFDIVPERLDVWVHPQSIVHGLVEFVDGSLLAGMAAPDMRNPVGYALNWPQRRSNPSRRLDLDMLGSLNFEMPDLCRFPALGLARDAMKAGPIACIALNAANEVVVAEFLDGRLGFTDMHGIVARTVAEIERLCGALDVAQLDEIMAVDARARAYAAQLVATGGAAP